MIEISLGSNELSSVDDVTVAPDQKTVYKTEYDNNLVKIYFKRGLMSNDQSGKNLSLTINLENIQTTSILKLNVKLYELKYDKSYLPTYERYTKIKNEDLNFSYVSVFSYPALELKKN